MEAGTLIIGAAVTILATAALAMRLGARLPRPPLAEVSLVAIFSALLAQAALVDGGDPPLVLVAVSMVAWLGFLAVFPTGLPEPRPVALLLAAACVPIVGQLAWPGLSATAPVAFIVAFGLGAGAQVWRYRRRSSVAERQATKWLLLGLIPALGVFLGLGLLSLLPAVGPGLFGHPAYAVAATSAMWAIPIAATVGVVVGERGPVDPLVVAAVAVTGTSVGVAGVYLGALSLGVGGGVATALACLAVVPLLATSRRLGERLVHARGPRVPLAQLPGLLAGASTPGEVAAAVADTLARALGSPAAAVVVDGEPVAAVGTDGGRAFAHPVAFQGEEVATLEVASRPGETQLSPRDQRTLAAVAGLAGPALYGARASRRVAEGAEALARTRDEERARLHADLHDDLGPTLAALGYLAAAASSAVETDPDSARDILGHLETQVKGAVGRVRELAYDLRPPELERVGLVALIRERVAGQDGSLEVTVDAELDDSLLDVDLQLAVLRIVQEAVANVRRHARARRCDVAIRRMDEGLVIIVTDDGVGPPERPVSAGIGLASIEQRAREFGGTSDFGRGAVGSVLRATLKEAT